MEQRIAENGSKECGKGVSENLWSADKIYKKLKEPVHKWPKVLAMKDCAIKCIDAATNECPVSCGPTLPLSPSPSVLRPPAGKPWDPVALSCKLILWPDCRIDSDNDNDDDDDYDDYLPNRVNSLLNNIALTCQQQNYLAFFPCVATDLLACPAHTESSSGNSLDRIRLHSNYKLHSPERNVQLK